MSGEKIFFSTKRSKNGPKNIPKKTGNFLDWDFGIWPKRDGFRDILDCEFRVLWVSLFHIKRHLCE